MEDSSPKDPEVFLSDMAGELESGRADSTNKEKIRRPVHYSSSRGRESGGTTQNNKNSRFRPTSRPLPASHKKHLWRKDP